MKRIVILNGAGKRNGNTAALVKAFAEGAESAGNQVTEFYLHGMDIKGCMDCQGCARKEPGDAHPCVQRDDMDRIYEVYADCDVLVFATPVYWFTISGQLKTAVDRLYAIQRNWGMDAAKKDTVLVMTAGAPVAMNVNALGWYEVFEKGMGWKSLGMALDTGSTEEARALGAGIC